MMVIFCLAVYIPFSFGIIEKDRLVSSAEKRKLLQLPEVPDNFYEIEKFPSLFDAYYSDQFGLRDFLAKQYNYIKYRIGDSPSDDVTVGRNGWLFLGSIKNGYTRYNDPIGDFRGTNLYSQKELEEIAGYFHDLNAWLTAHDMKYLLLIAPNKHTIYSDQLPEYLTVSNAESATDQLVKYLKQNTTVTVVDPRPLLIKEKNNYPLYFKHDTHWNAYAANLVQYDIFREIGKMFPGAIQPELQPIGVFERKGGDLARFIGIENLQEIMPKPIFKHTCEPKRYPQGANNGDSYSMTCNGQKLKALIFRDSFFTALDPFFSRKFYRCTYIWQKLNYHILAKYVNDEKPDIVIEEWVERSLPYVPPNHPLYSKSD